jgi:hypothetical protein
MKVLAVAIQKPEEGQSRADSVDKVQNVADAINT